ncbi:hypothetical protein [Haliangium sp.]|uniref:hypothetical protein n=1 Tax=Haliangium sp. TaxID=2663208 RepID=UPI003D0D5AD1
MRNHLYLCIVFAACMLGALPAAHADSVSLRGVVGVGGEVELEDDSADLDTSLGFDLLFMHDLHRYFAVGGALGALWWRGEDAPEDSDRNLLVTASLRPEGRVDVGRAQVFVGGAFGLTYSSIGEDEFFGGDIDPAFGYHLGVDFGARLRIGNGAGIEAGVGLVRHSVEHEIDTLIGSTSVDGTVTSVLLELGGFFEM